jgi:hypothetical protein
MPTLGPLNVLSLADAKLYLKVDFDDDDSLITSLIGTAVSYVEKATEYRLYQRPEIITLAKIWYEAFQFPLNAASVVAIDSADTNTYTVQQWPETLRTKLFWGNGNFWCDPYNNELNWNQNYFNLSAPPRVFTLTLDVGYADTTQVPTDLLAAIQQILEFTYDNRDLTMAKLPNNIQMLLSNYKRFATIL